MHNKFKNHDLVMVTQGEFRGIEGEVVDNESPILWVKLSTTNEIANIHENDLIKIKQ